MPSLQRKRTHEDDLPSSKIQDVPQARCWEATFVGYFFEEDRDYPPQSYPTNYKSTDPDDDRLRTYLKY